jgi:valyl-tRNA synthetase
MALYSYSAAGRDARTSREIMDERCKNFRNFETKIRNIARFIIDLAPKQANKSKNKRKTTFLHKDDKAIKAKLDKTEKEVTRHIDRFQLHLATQKLYNFIWHEFADDYLEKSKKRRSEAQPCLNFILERSLQLLSPFMPFLTAELQKKLIHHLDS